MYAVDFEFDGRRLSDFGCVLTTFNGMENGPVPSGADVVFNIATTSGSDIYNVFATNYDSPYSTTLSICKDPCVGDNATNPYFTPREASAIQSWLCRRTQYCKFKILEDGYEDIYWMGWFSSQQYMLGSHIAGFEVTFTADAPYGYLEDISLHYTCTANTGFNVDSMSYEEGYVIPNIVITCKAAGNFQLTNNRDDKITKIDNCTNGEVITIDGKTLYISSSRASHDLAIDFNFLYPRIFNKYGDTKNTFTPNMACTIDVTYTPAIKVGF